MSDTGAGSGQGEQAGDDGRPLFDPAVDPPRADDVPEDHPVRLLLSSAADDPGAPPSSVTITSVLAAVRRAAGTGVGADSDADIERVTDIDPVTGRPRYVPPVYARPIIGSADSEAGSDAASGPVAPPQVPTPLWSASAASAATPPASTVVPASVLAARQVRRRRRLVIFAAAACVGVAAVAVPFALSRSGSSTSTSASAPEATTFAAGSTTAGAAGTAAGGAAAATTTLGFAGGGDGTSPASSAAGTAASAAASVPVDPPLGAPTTGAGAAESAGGEAGTGSCSWTPLPATVATALTGVLPGGFYGDPQPLTTGCRPDGVYGATLPSLQSQPALSVTVRRAAEGACATTTTPCDSMGGGDYVAVTADGQFTAYAYVSGWEVMIAPDGVDTGDPSSGSATVDELLAAAQAAAVAAAAG